MLDSVLGVVGSGFAVVAAGTSAVRTSLVFHNPDGDRVSRLGPRLLLGVSGIPGDCVRLRETVKLGVSLEKIGSAAAAADVARGAVLAYASSVSAVLLAGYDDYDGGEGPAMYAVGGVGAAPPERVLHGAAGCGSGLCTPVLEREYRPGMSVKEAVGLVDRCIKEVRRVGVASFVIMIVDKDGAREYARRIPASRVPITFRSDELTTCPQDV